MTDLGRYRPNGSGGVNGRFPLPLAPKLPFRFRPKRACPLCAHPGHRRATFASPKADLAFGSQDDRGGWEADVPSFAIYGIVKGCWHAHRSPTGRYPKTFTGTDLHPPGVSLSEFIDYSGNPAFRRASAHLAKSSVRRNGSKSLRLERRSAGSTSRMRTMSFRASPSRPASA